MQPSRGQRSDFIFLHQLFSLHHLKCKTTSDKALLQFLLSQSAFQHDTKEEKNTPQKKRSPTQRDHLIPSAATFVQCSSSWHRKTWRDQKDRGKRCREKFQGWNSPELKSTAGETKAVLFLSPLDKIQQLSGRKIEFLL